MRTQLATNVERDLIKLEEKRVGKNVEEIEDETVGELKTLPEAYSAVLDSANREY